MPSKSKAQHNLMEAVAHNAAFAKKVGIPQKVGKDFVEADKGKKFSSGGMESMSSEQSINKPKTHHGASALFKEGGSMATRRAINPGMAAMMAARPSMPAMKKGGETKKMSKGGMTETMGPKTMSSDVEKGSNKKGAHGEHAIQKKGHTRAMMPKMAGSDTGMKRGGKVKK